MAEVLRSFFAARPAAELARDLCSFAISDVQASRVLYRNGLYPLAIFHTQQSVEKATKSLALLMRLLKPTYGEIVKAVRHESVEAILFGLPDYIDSQIKTWEQAQVGWNKVKEEPGAKFFRALTKFNEQIEKSSGIIEKHRDTDALRRQIETYRKQLKSSRRHVWQAQVGLTMDPRVDSMIADLRKRTKEAKAARKFLGPIKELYSKFSMDSDLPVYLININAVAFHMAVPLGFLTMLHEEATRYPPTRDADYWTSQAYTADSKLVRLLPELNSDASMYCEAIKDGAETVLGYHSRTSTQA